MAGNDPNYQAAGVAISTVDTAAEVDGFWKRTLEETKNLSQESFKQQELPLARIKKIMKLDEDVKMISAEAPVLFAKASEIFISELSLRAWIHTEDNKRRTLQRNDLATAISKFDQYDFLIDIVPRDELKPAKREEGVPRASMLPDQVQYYFQLAQQHQAAMQQQSQGSVQTQQQQPQTQQQAVQGGQIVQQVQTQLSAAASQPATPETQAVQTNAQVLQIQSSPQGQTQAAAAQSQAQAQQQTTQVFMQIVTPSGEVQNVPVQLPQAQLQSIQQQLQGKQAGQPIIIQTSMPVSNQSDQDGAQQQQFSSTQPMYQVQQVPQQVFVQQQAEDADGEQTTHVELTQEGSS